MRVRRPCAERQGIFPVPQKRPVFEIGQRRHFRYFRVRRRGCPRQARQQLFIMNFRQAEHQLAEFRPGFSAAGHFPVDPRKRRAGFERYLLFDAPAGVSERDSEPGAVRQADHIIAEITAFRPPCLHFLRLIRVEVRIVRRQGNEPPAFLQFHALERAFPRSHDDSAGHRVRDISELSV